MEVKHKPMILLIALPILAILLFRAQNVDGRRNNQRNDCDCDYKLTGQGCIINKSPPEGWKCQCRVSQLTGITCIGRAYPCNSYEKCPANCYSEECCMKGGGNCDGYRYIPPAARPQPQAPAPTNPLDEAVGGLNYDETESE